MPGYILPSSITLEESAAPATPASNHTILYVKSDGLVYYKDDTGTEYAASGYPTFNDEIGATSVSANSIIVPSGSLTDEGGNVARLHYVPRADVRKTFAIVASGAVYGYMGIPSANVTVTATATASNQTDAPYVNQATTAVLGNISGIISAGFNQLRLGYNPYAAFLVRTAASVAVMRMYIGWFGSAPTNSDNAPNNSACVRYSSVAGDPGWVGLCRDASAQTLSGNLASIVASTRYLIEMYKSSTAVNFRVNGGAWAAVSANLPSNNTDLGFGARVITNEAVAKSLQISRVYMEMD